MVKNINHGYTMDYFIKGVFAIIFGACFTFLAEDRSWIVGGMMLLILGTCLFLIQTGVSVDGKNKRIRKMRSLLGLRFGDWHYLEKYDALMLRFTNEESVSHGPSFSKLLQAKTFDLILIEDNKKKEIYEFKEFKNAKQCIAIINSELGIKVKNRFGI